MIIKCTKFRRKITDKDGEVFQVDNYQFDYHKEVTTLEETFPGQDDMLELVDGLLKASSSKKRSE